MGPSHYSSVKGGRGRATARCTSAPRHGHGTNSSERRLQARDTVCRLPTACFERTIACTVEELRPAVFSRFRPLRPVKMCASSEIRAHCAKNDSTYAGFPRTVYRRNDSQHRAEHAPDYGRFRTCRTTVSYTHLTLPTK